MHSHGFVIARDHPALPGHFPGNPVVPGAVLLDCVRQVVLDASPGARIAVVRWVKFLIPVSPGQRFVADLQARGQDIRFQCRVGEVVVLRGALVLARAGVGS